MSVGRGSLALALPLTAAAARAVVRGQRSHRLAAVTLVAHVRAQDPGHPPGAPVLNRSKITVKSAPRHT